MAAPVLTHRHIFGLKSDVRDAVHYLEENVVLYPAGHNVIIYNTDTKQQRFIHGSDVNGPQGRTEICALAVSPNKRYVAVAERGIDHALVTVYDVRTLKKRKTLVSSEMRSREFVSLCFSPDNKSLLTLGGSPDYTLIHWLWQKTKPLQIVRIEGTTLAPLNNSSNTNNNNSHQLSSTTSSSASSTTNSNILNTITTNTNNNNNNNNTASPSQCSFCPHDPSLLCVTGRYTLLFFRIEIGSNKLRPLETTLFGREFEDYTTHAWMLNGTKRIMVGTSSGSILYLENTMFRCVLSTTQENNNSKKDYKEKEEKDTSSSSTTTTTTVSKSTTTSSTSSNNSGNSSISPKCIEYILAFNNGFVVGCDSGLVLSYTVNGEDLDTYQLQRVFHMDSTSSSTSSISSISTSSNQLASLNSFSSLTGSSARVKSLAISPADEHLLVATDTSQTLLLRNFHTDVLKSEEMRFEPLSVLFHNGAITGLDTCVRKPIVITCGVDRSVRVWNYLTRTVELCVFFNEQPHSVALHPSGLHCLVGFTDKLRLMNILMDDIRPYKEFQIKSCSECQFSNGGHLFAAINVGLIQIYNTYTCEQVGVFRGHTGLVRSLYWSLDDTQIVSAGVDGAVYERRLGHSQRSQEHVQKGCRFTSALCTEDDKIYAVGDDRMLKEILDKNVNKTLDAGVILTQLCVSHPPQRMLFAGTINGVVRSFTFPLTGVVKDYQCHSKSVSRMRITSDDSYLFSVSEDGCLSIFQIKEKENHASHSHTKRDALNRTDSSNIAYSEEILVTKSDLEEKNAYMQELKSKVDELTASNDYQLRVHDMSYQEKLKEVSDKYNIQIEHDKSRIEMLRDEKQELEMEMDEKITLLKTQHANTLHQQDLEHQKAIMREVGRYQKLQEAMEEEGRENALRVRDRYIQHGEEITKLREQFESQLVKEREEAKSELSAKNLVIREYRETKRQLEEDTDKEVELLKRKYEKKLQNESDATLRLKGENGIMRKKFSALQKDIEDQKENIKMMAEKEEQLLTQIKLLEEKIASHKQEIKERDKTIGENEKEIYRLKKENQELEKWKFVYDDKIRDLKKQIEPRENQIADMKDTVSKMDAQLECYHRENRLLQENVIELEKKLKMKISIIKRQRQLYRRALSDLNALSNDLHDAVAYIQSPEKLKECIKKLYSTHVTERIQHTEIDPDVNKEYRRQRVYLEESVDVLKKKLHRDMKARKNDNMRVMQENVALIKEINKMRREIKLMHQVQRQNELNSATRPNHNVIYADTWDQQEALKILEMQKTQIETLRLHIEEAQARLMHARPPSSSSRRISSA